MPARTLAFVLLLLCVSVLAQQPGMGARLNGRMWSDREVRPEPVRTDPQVRVLKPFTATRRNSLSCSPLCKSSSSFCKKECCTKTWPRP